MIEPSTSSNRIEILNKYNSVFEDEDECGYFFDQRFVLSDALSDMSDVSGSGSDIWLKAIHTLYNHISSPVTSGCDSQLVASGEHIELHCDIIRVRKHKDMGAPSDAFDKSDFPTNGTCFQIMKVYAWGSRERKLF